MDVDPGYECILKFKRAVQCYMLKTKDFNSSIKFKLKNEINDFVSFNGQSITFRISINEI